MKLREWLNFVDVDRTMWIVIEQELSDGRIKQWSSPSVNSVIMSAIGWREIVQAKITKKGSLWILIK